MSNRKSGVLLVSLLAASTAVAVMCTYAKVAKLEQVEKSNLQVAEETRELTEAIHENNRLLELIESSTGPKTIRLN